ncbi:Hypothetical protein PBC10988_21210 [Planctomycetales bacterium 10988]|nr:Hypothetical protein PBC10988_21210 [Planctomycetales bacterium 10988]
MSRNTLKRGVLPGLLVVIVTSFLSVPSLFAQRTGNGVESSQDATRGVALEIGRSLLRSLIEKQPTNAELPVTTSQPMVPVPDRNTRSIQPVPNTNNYYSPSSSTSNQLPSQLIGQTRPLSNKTVQLGRGEVAGLALTQRTGEELNEWLDAAARDLNFQMQPLFVPDQERDELVRQLNGRVSRQYLLELQDALIDEDADALDKAARKANLPQAQREELVRRIAVTGTAKRILRKLRNDESPIAISYQSRQLKRMLMAKEIPAEQRESLNKELDKIMAGARARKATETALIQSGTKLDWPSGAIPVIYSPSMEQGKYYLLNDYALLVGVGEQGQMTCEMSTVARAIGVPVAEGEPVPEYRQTDSNPLNGVMVVNPEHTQTAVNFMVAGRTYRLDPGQTQTINSNSYSLVEFDRGGNYGHARYQLNKGVYIFVPTQSGWDLFNMPYQITLDNSENPHDFHYAIDGKRERVLAYESKTLNSESPFVIVFDRGNGQQLSRKILFNGIYKVGVRSTDEMWDLFESQESESEMPATLPLTMATFKPVAPTPRTFGR